MRIFPFLSLRMEKMPPSASADARARSISSATVSVSTMSSRGVDWTPIFTSTTFLSAEFRVDGARSNEINLPTPRTERVCPPAPGPQANRARARAIARPLAGERPAADAAPRQPAQQLLRGILWDVLPVAHPVACADIGHADQPHAEQVRLVVPDAGILPDHLADHFGALLHRGIQPFPHGGLITKI